MKNMNMNQAKQLIFSLITLTVLISVAVPAAAQGEYPETRGLYLGVTAGVGGGQIHWKESSRTVSEDPEGGAMGSFRVGYSFNNKLAAGVDFMGFGSEENDGDDDLGWSLGASLATVTWRPTGRGFFVRGGVGVGGGHYLHPDTKEEVEISDRAAWLFSLGYDWRLSEHAMLGLVVDGLMMDAGSSSGFEDDEIGSNGLSVQFTWLL